MALIDDSYFFGDLAVAQLSSVAADLQWYIDEYENKLLVDLLGYELVRDFKAGLQVDPIPSKWTDLLYGVEYTNSRGKLDKWCGLIEATDVLHPGTYTPDDIEIVITGALIGATSYVNPFLVGKNFRVVQRAIGNLGSDIATINSNGFTLINGDTFTANNRYYIEFIAPAPLPTPATSTAGAAKLSLIANYVFYQYSQAQRTVSTGTGEKQLAAQNATNASALDKEIKAWNKMVGKAQILADFLQVNATIYPQWDKGCEPYRYKNSLGL